MKTLNIALMTVLIVVLGGISSYASSGGSVSGSLVTKNGHESVRAYFGGERTSDGFIYHEVGNGVSGGFERVHTSGGFERVTICNGFEEGLIGNRVER